VIYVPGLLAPKEHHIPRWQFDELTDPAGPHKLRVAFVNWRGHHGNPLTSARLFDPLYDDEDLAVAISYLHTVLPQSPLIALGCSYGGPNLTRYSFYYTSDDRYLARIGSRCPLHAAVIFSPCFNIARGLRTLHDNPVTRPGSIYSAQQISKMYDSVAPKFEKAGLPIDKMPRPKGPGCAELYEVAIPYLTGMKYDEYTESLLHTLEVGIPDISIPTFFIGSYRDVFTGYEVRLHRGIEKNPNMIRLMNQSRSHIGYFSGLFKPKRWAQKPMFEFILVLPSPDKLITGHVESSITERRACLVGYILRWCCHRI
jgi:predicted alpha/beta-fold hydrolase